MLEIEIPSFKKINVENIVFDYNGTLAVDGNLIEGVKERLLELTKILNVYILTADTYGTVKENFEGLNVDIHIISKGNERLDKYEFVKYLGFDKTITVGNGNNDLLMIKESAIGICVLGREGLATETFINSDIIVNNIVDVFDMIIEKRRLIATLRK
ncbi:Soluble P-type ATPase [Caminicella sporogenes DSM 14501]|uniref:Soluble P-type ATPase n=1 Tax=Caminicella sporogenes DSM 14501 TaxID=1121266 RepID=A0A1M6NQB1_9FIRM|nr:HAD family hydrolase [Caminicella sporogenes]RKD22126.1 hypothetical protein BET04_05730 [Caminicella sporogenes]WIF95742.1 HAD family hydrolase [Caminicella sporogenes]SHJ97762.1 Soluble P-type ATPase [Caminicella sporogenes DSM 14501]